jgi:hypothetical protein
MQSAPCMICCMPVMPCVDLEDGIVHLENTVHRLCQAAVLEANMLDVHDVHLHKFGLAWYDVEIWTSIDHGTVAWTAHEVISRSGSGDVSTRQTTCQLAV